MFPENYTVSAEPFLNSYYKNYQTILTVDRMPVGPISAHVKRVNAPKLSPFISPSLFDGPFDNCTFAFVRNPNSFSMKGSSPFLTELDIPSLIGFLRANGYTIDMETVKIMHKAKIVQNSGAKRMIFVFTK